MSNRSTREIKAPQRLEDEQEDASSTIANVGRKSRAAKIQEASEIKQEDATAELSSAAVWEKNRGRGRSRGRSRGPGRGRRRGRGGGEDTGRPAKRRRVDSPSSDRDAGSEPPTSPIDGDAAVGGSDQDYDDDQSFDSVVRDSLLKPGKRHKHSVNLIPNIPTGDEATIEQWYTDPYERINPETSAYDEWRRINLEKSMALQGFDFIRAKPVVSWLIECNGHYKPPGSTKKKRARRNRKNKNGETSQAPSETSSPDAELYNDVGTVGTMDTDLVAEFGQQGGLDDYDDSIVEEDEEAETRGRHQWISTEMKLNRALMDSPTGRAKCKASRIRATNTVSDLTRAAVKNAANVLSPEPMPLCKPSRLRRDGRKADIHNEPDVNAQIAQIKLSLKVFQVIYGDNLPDPDYSKYDFNHVSSTTRLPRSVPRNGFRTQCHKPLRYALAPKGSTALTNHTLEPRAHRRNEGQANHGLQHNQTQPHDAQVLTEDPHFGNHPFDRSQIYTLEEQEMLRVQQERQELRDLNANDADLALPGLRGEEAQTNEHERQLVLHQLKRKVWLWETEWSNTYVLTDGNGVPNGNFYRVREDNEKWKRLAERQAILDAGGEAAQRIHMEEMKAAQDGEKREKRREERLRQTARKKAKALGMERGGTGLSGWTAEY